MLIAACICGETEATPETHFELPMLRCRCGVLRQAVEMTGEEYSNWYRERYHAGVYAHSYEHDRRIAERRLVSYALKPGSKLLDIGSGNNAFVDAANEAGLDAWGEEPALVSEGPRTYVGMLEDVNFPALGFDVITIHDVLEHVPDMRRFLREVARMMARPSTLILDFPRFHDPAGEHHWKPTEHLWMLDEAQLRALLKSEGFRVEKIEHPIPSKIVVTATNTRQPSPVKILVPPGIGDGYWTFVLLKSFLDQRGIYLPEVWVHGSGHRRADGFWSRVPFVRFGGYADLPKNDPALRVYKQPGFALQRDVHGFDYFISLNGDVDAGRTVEEGLPGPVANWYEPIFQPKAHDAHRERFRAAYGEYVACAFFDQGFYTRWLKAFDEAKIVATLKLLADAGKTVVVMGAAWDAKGIAPRIAAADERFVSLIGETTFDELTGLLDGAAGVLGFPAGNTLLGPYYRKPTLLFWESHFPPGFWVNTVPPDAKLYVPYHVVGAKPAEVAEAMLAILRGEMPEIPAFPTAPPAPTPRTPAVAAVESGNVIRGKVMPGSGRWRPKHAASDITARRREACGMALAPGTIKIVVPDVEVAMLQLGEPKFLTEETSSHGALRWWPVVVEAGKETADGFVIRHSMTKTPFLEVVSSAPFDGLGNGWPVRLLLNGEMPTLPDRPPPSPPPGKAPSFPTKKFDAAPIVAALGPPVDTTAALIVGGAQCVWDDVRALEAMLGRPWDGLVIAANDVGAAWPGRLDHWATLHPERLAAWIGWRREAGLPDGFTTWSVSDRARKLKSIPGPPPRRYIANVGAGASGMLGVSVALELGCSRVVLAGIPMDKSPHFDQSRQHQRGKPWPNAGGHWKPWIDKSILAKFAGRVKSMSGKTAEVLGMPFPEWLNESGAA